MDEHANGRVMLALKIIGYVAVVGIVLNLRGRAVPAVRYTVLVPRARR